EARRLDERRLARSSRARARLDAALRGARRSAPRLANLLDHPVGPPQHGCGNGQTQLLRGPEVDHQLEPCGLLYRKVRWSRALEDSVHVVGGAADEILVVGRVGGKPARLDEPFG